jgi:hypothetical protein
MQHHLAELDELNSRYTAQLFKEFAELGIHAWYDGSVSGPVCRGGAFFAVYDALETCFRLFPSSTRYFQASLLSGLISRQQARALSRLLVAFARRILPEYDGRFSGELKTNIIDEYLTRITDAADAYLFEAQKGLFPDALHAAIPVMAAAGQFRQGEFGEIVFHRDEFAMNATHPLWALTSAAELISLGPGLNLSSRTISNVLDWLADGADRRSDGGRASIYPGTRAERVVIPMFSYGLQGRMIGFFNNLPLETRKDVRIRLHQFGQHLAERSVLIRQRQLLETFEDVTGLGAFLRALIELISPIQHVVATSGGECVGYRMRAMGDFWAGHARLAGEEARALTRDPANHIVEVDLSSRRVRVYVKPWKEFAAFETAFAWLRTRENPRQVLVDPLRQRRLRPLVYPELKVVQATLQQQISEAGRGGHAACKILYLIESARAQYSKGELVLTNSRSQVFMRQKLEKIRISGYQVCGEALVRFIADVEKLLPQRFSFEPVASKAVLVRWIPVLDQAKMRGGSTVTLSSGSEEESVD